MDRMIYEPREIELKDAIILSVQTIGDYVPSVFHKWVKLGCPRCYYHVEQSILPDDTVVFECLKCGWKQTDGR